MSEFSGLLSKLKKAAEVLKDEISGLDAQIHTLNQERQFLLDAPVSKVDFIEYVKADIAKRGQAYIDNIPSWFNKHNPNTYVNLEKLSQPGKLQHFPYMDGISPEYGTNNFGAISITPVGMYWLFGDLIAERFAAAIDGLDWPSDTMAIADRRKRVAEIDDELESLVDKRDGLAAELMSAGIME